MKTQKTTVLILRIHNNVVMNLDNMPFDFLLLPQLEGIVCSYVFCQNYRRVESAQRDGSTEMTCSNGLFACEVIHNHLCIQSLWLYKFCVENNVWSPRNRVFSWSVQNEKPTNLTASSTVYGFGGRPTLPPAVSLWRILFFCFVDMISLWAIEFEVSQTNQGFWARTIFWMIRVHENLPTETPFKSE